MTFIRGHPEYDHLRAPFAAACEALDELRRDEDGLTSKERNLAMYSLWKLVTSHDGLGVVFSPSRVEKLEQEIKDAQARAGHLRFERSARAAILNSIFRTTH